MNDRFKLRVWDKVFNNYWTNEEIKENSGWLLFPDNGNIDDIEIEQCTGLKDKNGKLIFEGDVVLLDKYNYSILWNDCWCIFRERSEQITHVNSSCLEVIGNIHENPELLK